MRSSEPSRTDQSAHIRAGQSRYIERPHAPSRPRQGRTALTLADRIILFSARPGQVKDMFEVDIARPRDAVKVRETPRYAELFQHIWHSLGEEFVKGRSA